MVGLLLQNVNRPAALYKRVSDAYVRLTHTHLLSSEFKVQNPNDLCMTQSINLTI